MTEQHTPATLALTKKGERYAAENAPGEPQDGPSGPVVDHTLRDRMLAGVARLEALADEIIALLDELQGEPDLEPVLGALELSPHFTTQAFREGLDQRRWADTGDVDEREPTDDDEPSLGSLDSCGSTFPKVDRWAGGGSSDLEDEHDGREPEDDSEPQCEDEGAQCEDEGADIGDYEPDDHHLCGWISGEVDQTKHYLPGRPLTGIDYADNGGRHPWDRSDG